MPRRRLPARAADIWTADLTHPRDPAMLTDEERVRAARLRSDHARDRWIASRVFLRETLARYAEDVDIVVGADAGKPRLRSEAVAFNFAHSGDVAMLAVSDGEVGIDVEQIREGRDLLALARRAFAPDVADSVAGDADPVGRFYAEWTRHEARTKCLGVGLFEGGAAARALVVVDLAAPAGYAAALATPEALTALTHCQT